MILKQHCLLSFLWLRENPTTLTDITSPWLFPSTLFAWPRGRCCSVSVLPRCATLIVPTTRRHKACVGLHRFLATSFFCFCITHSFRTSWRGRRPFALHEYAPCDHESMLSQPKRSFQILNTWQREQRVSHYFPRYAYSKFPTVYRPLDRPGRYGLSARLLRGSRNSTALSTLSGCTGIRDHHNADLDPTLPGLFISAYG